MDFPVDKLNAIVWFHCLLGSCAQCMEIKDIYFVEKSIVLHYYEKEKLIGYQLWVPLSSVPFLLRGIVACP